VLRFLRAKINPGDAGGTAPKAAPPSVSNGPRTSRILDGNVEPVGVAGRTLTLECGDLGFEAPIETVGEAMDADAEDVEDALECE